MDVEKTPAAGGAAAALDYTFEPVQVILRFRTWVSGCGIRVAAASVYIHVCETAVGCDFMRGAAAAGVQRALGGMVTIVGELSVVRKFLLTVLVLAAAAAAGCDLLLAAAIDRINTFVDEFTVLWGTTSLQGPHFAWSSQT